MLVTYTYDDVGRLERRQYSDGARVTFSYDPLGNRLEMQDSSGTTTYTYDPLSRLQTVHDSNDKFLQYGYDSRGPRTSMIDADGGVFTYSYDALGRTQWLVNPSGERTTYSYDRTRRSGLRMGNGARVTYTYDAVGQIVTLLNSKDDGTVISSFDYGYDPVGNRLNVTEADGTRVTWSYDDRYQLTREQRGADYDFEYTYDAVGNRLTKVEGATRTTYTYDAANQLTTLLEGDNLTTYTYDQAGNTTLQVLGAQRTTFTWDGDNRLTEVNWMLGILPFNTTRTYNGDGQVVVRDANGTPQRWIWDGQNILHETNDAGATTCLYTREPALYGLLLSRQETSDSYQYLFDALGSTDRLLDDTQTPIEHYIYDAFGSIRDTESGIFQSYMWIGRLGYVFANDPGDDFYYVRARNYWPKLGRWVSRDPIGFAGGSWNLYDYVGGRPISLIDPSGHEVHCPCSGTLSDVRKRDEKENTLSGSVRVATIYCKGGKLIPVFVVDPSRFDPCEAECLLEHERQHIEQQNYWCPTFCSNPEHEGGVAGIPYIFRGALYEESTNFLECDAYSRELSCLNQKLKAGTAHCNPHRIRARIEEIINVQMPRYKCHLRRLPPLLPPPPQRLPRVPDQPQRLPQPPIFGPPPLPPPSSP